MNPDAGFDIMGWMMEYLAAYNYEDVIRGTTPPGTH